MKFTVGTHDVLELSVDLLALPSFQEKLDHAYQFNDLDRALDGMLSSLASEEDFTAKEDQSLLIHTHGKIGPKRILLVGLGKREDFQIPDVRRYAAQCTRQAVGRRCESLALALPPVDPSAHDLTVQFLTEGAHLGRYRFEKYLTKDSRTTDKLQQLDILLPPERTNGDRGGAVNLAMARGDVVADAVCFARDLVNEPGSVMTPARLAELAQGLTRDDDITCKVLGPKEIEKQKMGLLLAVANGSTLEPRFIHLTYKPKGKEKPKRKVVLVGKGITFDSGGLSLKPGNSMEGMKTDMAGAAAVLAMARALSPLAIKAEVHLLVPTCENMPSGSSYRVGDIVTGMAGKSVEVLNTDAEGRLILADALAYGVKLGADEIIDLATLTGACMVALGPHIAGVMGNDRAMVERFLASARRVGEEVWPLPLPQRLREQLKSPVADIKNIGDRWGGALTAGLFLKEFVDKTAWIHLDIAGPASADKEWGHIPKGGTGFGVPSVLEYLRTLD